METLDYQSPRQTAIKAAAAEHNSRVATFEYFMAKHETGELTREEAFAAISEAAQPTITTEMVAVSGLRQVT
jgi:hypothetical protein